MVLTCVLTFNTLASNTGLFRPNSDQQVLETVRGAITVDADRRLKELREQVRARPTDLPATILLVRALIEKNRAEADPRALAQAQVLLKNWSTSSGSIPVELLVLRGIIHQRLHQFDVSLEDLDRAVQLDPYNAQAWLTKASVHLVRGDHARARDACVALMRVQNDLNAIAITAHWGSLTGSARNSYRTLSKALAESQRTPRTPATELVWIQTLLGEIATRLGDVPAAEAHFQSALAVAPTDPYLLGVYADFLMDQGRAKEVSRWLAPHARIDALLLRLTEANLLLSGRNSGKVQEQIAALGARFDAARLRGDAMHQREESRFQCRLANNPLSAMQLARENWKVQREPADARAFLEAARAAKDAQATLEILEWLRTTKLEDVSLWGQSLPQTVTNLSE